MKGVSNLALVGLVISAAWFLVEGVGNERHLASADQVTPLFERRMAEMAVQFEAAPAYRGHAVPGGSNRQMMQSDQQALIYPSEAASGCLGSGCIGSACAGSECIGSACLGSVCVGSECLQCSRPLPPNPTLALTGGRAYCPLDGGAGAGEVRVTSFEVAPTADGTEIRFAVSGADLQSYRVYRRSPGSDRVLLAHGTLAGDQLNRLVAADVPGDTDYTLEVVDMLGRITRTDLLGSSRREVEVAAGGTDSAGGV